MKKETQQLITKRKRDNPFFSELIKYFLIVNLSIISIILFIEIGNNHKEILSLKQNIITINNQKPKILTKEIVKEKIKKVIVEKIIKIKDISGEHILKKEIIILQKNIKNLKDRNILLSKKNREIERKVSILNNPKLNLKIEKDYIDNSKKEYNLDIKKQIKESNVSTKKGIEISPEILLDKKLLEQYEDSPISDIPLKNIIDGARIEIKTTF